MRDFEHLIEALDQRASATVTIDDYSVLSGKVVTLEGTAKTEGVDWTAATDNDTTATSLASALDAIAGFSASATGAVITIYFETPGTGGNAKTLTTDAVSGLTLSGATLADGVDETLTDWFDMGTMDSVKNVEETLTVDVLSGTLPTIDVTPLYSHNKIDTHDADVVFTQVTAAVAAETLDQELTGVYRRWKIVLGGTNPIATGAVRAIAK